MTELPAVYEDEMDERYSVKDGEEYERQLYRDLHEERKALFMGAISHALPDIQWGRFVSPDGTVVAEANGRLR